MINGDNPIWKQIAATFIGALPLFLAVGGMALTLIKDNERHDVEIKNLQVVQARMEVQLQIARSELLARMDRLSLQIEDLQKRKGATP